MAELQQDPTKWRNLAHSDCAARNYDGRQSPTTFNATISYMVVVTNYTAPLVHNNSALAIGVMSNYVLTPTERSSLLALCPDIYLELNKGARRPSLVPLLGTWSSNPDVTFADSDQAERDGRYADFPDREGVSADGPDSISSSVSALRDQDLCYDYWALRWSTDGEYLRPRFPFLYCMVKEADEEGDDVEVPRCSAVYSVWVVYVLATTLTLKLIAMSAALFKICRRPSFQCWQDAIEFYAKRGEDVDRWKERQLRAQRRESSLMYLIVGLLCVIILVWAVLLFFMVNLAKVPHHPASLR